MISFYTEDKKFNLLLNVLGLSVLLFALSPLPFLPWGAAYRYLFYIVAPLSVLALFFSLFTRSKAGRPKTLWENCLYFVLPFTPFLISYVIIRVSYLNAEFIPGIAFGKICAIILLNGLVFGTFKYFDIKVKLRYFYLVCGLGSLLGTVDCISVSFTQNVSVFEIRHWVSSFPTIYGRCLCLLGGLSIIGAFVLKNASKTFKVFLIISGLSACFTSIGFLGIRATILGPVLAFLTVFFILGKQSIQKRGLILLVMSLFCSFIVLVSPLSDRLWKGYVEVQNVFRNPSIDNVLEKNSLGKELTSEEETAKKTLNNSLGARIAVWKIAQKVPTDQILLGTGKGKPENHIPVKKLFSYSKDYLPHFHSDYVQSYVVGGLILTIGLVLTQLLLLWNSRREPIKIFLILLMLSYGLIDLGFLDIRSMTCFMGAWLILSLKPLFLPENQS